MPKATKRHNKSKGELIQETADKKNAEFEARKQEFIKEVEALEKKHKIRIGIEMIYAKSGIVPRFVLTDNPVADEGDSAAE